MGDCADAHQHEGHTHTTHTRHLGEVSSGGDRHGPGLLFCFSLIHLSFQVKSEFNEKCRSRDSDISYMSYKCQFDKCDRVLTTEQGLVAHTEAMHGRSGTHRAMRAWEKGRKQLGRLTLDSSEHARCDTKYSVKYEEAYDSDREEWVCYFCGQGFAEGSHLEQHLNSGIHESSRYHCQGCSRKFKTLSGLQQHTNSTACSAYSRRLVQVAVQDSQERLMLTDRSSSLRFEAELNFDGSTREGNPSSVGGCGWVLYNAYNRQEILAEWETLTGDDFPWVKHAWQVTNNQAEYMGLLRGLQSAAGQGIRRLRVKGDSELVIKQMLREYDVIAESIKPLYLDCIAAAREFQAIDYVHVYREDNTRADDLARTAAA